MTPLRHHIRATLALGLPLIGSQVAQILIILTDTIMIGWYGVAELAAVALGGSYFHTVLIVGMGFALAVTPLVAAAAAQEDSVQVRRVTRMGLWLALVFSAAMMPLFVFCEPILLALGQEATVSANTRSYLDIAGWALWPSLMFLVLRSHLSALEHTRIVLLATLAAVALNAGLNYLLIFGNFGLPEMGLRGAAWASIASNTLIFMILALYATRKQGLRDYTLFARFWRPDWEAFIQVFRLAWPIALTLLAESALFMASVLMMGWVDELTLAAHGIALQITALTFMVHVGLSTAATVRAGRAWGVKDFASLRLAAIAALILSGIMVAATIVVFVTLPAPLVAAFVGPDDPLRDQIIAIGVGLLMVSALFHLADAAQVMALGLLRGVQDTRVPMIIATISYWLVGIPCSYLFGFVFDWGGQGVWLGLVVGLVLAGGFMMVRFWSKVARLNDARPDISAA
ncbi:MATE family efflux transporter [Rhodophyticola sp. SM2404]